jgi:nucleoside-diphosphate-sugar epimerase
MLKEKTCLVTGCAGFIGSHLTEKLLAEGYYVIGIDAMRDYYDLSLKEKNLSLLKNNNFEFIKADLNKYDLGSLIDRVDYVFHEAAQAGVRASWGGQFNIYVEDNVLATQKLLEAAKGQPLKKLIFASSSSVYGDSAEKELSETSELRPVSPYGVTKLAAEKLAYVYWKNYQLPVTSLRYFTVFGPRQRPDMALYKFIRAALQEEEIEIYGDGEQKRDFTYVSDIVQANISVMKQSPQWGCFNIGSGGNQTVNEVLDKIGRLTGKKLAVRYSGKVRGDVTNTRANISVAREYIKYAPQIGFEQGLKEQIEYMRKSLKIG